MSIRQLAKKFGIGPVRMGKALILHPQEKRKITTEYRMVGDGKGQPVQELILFIRKEST